MMINSRICACLLLSAALVGCGRSESGLPTAPTPPPVATPTPTPTTQGAISLGTVTHPGGSTLTVHDCGPSWTGIAGNHVCTEEWRGAFEVVVNRDVAAATITVTFEGPAGRCGILYVSDLAFAAGRERVVSTSAALFLTTEPEGYDNLAVVQYCSLPTTTQRLVVQLWEHGAVGSSAVPLLRQEFDYPYTFTLR